MSAGSALLTVITEAQQAPVAQDDALAVTVGGAARTREINLLTNTAGADSDGNKADSLTVANYAVSGTLDDSLTELPAMAAGSHGTLTVTAAGAATYTPAGSGAAGDTDAFTYRVTDGNSDAATNSATATLTVTYEANVAPVARDDALAAVAGHSRVIEINLLSNAAGADSDGNAADSLTVANYAAGAMLDDSLTALPAMAAGMHGSLTVTAAGAATYTPAGTGAAGDTDAFTYQVTDGNSDSATNSATATLTVTYEANAAPVAAADVLAAVFGGADATVNVLEGGEGGAGADSDGNGQDMPRVSGYAAGGTVSPSTSFTAAGESLAGSHGSLVIMADGSAAYTPNVSGTAAPATDVFTYRITDGNAEAATNSAEATLTVTVAANATPVAADDTLAVTIGGAAGTLNLLEGKEGGAGADSDANPGDMLAVTGYLAGDTAGGTPMFTAAGTALAGMHGSLTVTAAGAATYTVNDPPPAAGSTDVFTYRITDGNRDSMSNSDTATLTVTAEANQAPMAAADTLRATAGGRVRTLDLLGNDSDGNGGDTLAVTGYTAGATLGMAVTAAGMELAGSFGTLAIAAGGEATYTPGDSAGEDVFSYRVTDGNGDAMTNSDTATLTVTVGAANVAPMAGNDTLRAVATGPAVTVNVLGNDSDGNAADTLAVAGYTTGATLGMSVTAAGMDLAGSFGTLAIAAGGLASYTPGAAAGEDTFTYRVMDDSGEEGNSATATLTVTVAAVEAGAPGVAGTVSTQVTAPGQDFELDLSGLAVTDPDGDAAAVILAVAPAGGGALPGWLAFDRDARLLSGEPAAADVGTLELAVTPTDSAGLAGVPLAFTLLVREAALGLETGFVRFEDRLYLRVTQRAGSVPPAAAVAYVLEVSSPTVNLAAPGAAAAASHSLTLSVPAGSPAGTVHETVLTFDRANSPGDPSGDNDVTATLGYAAAAPDAFAIAGPAMATQRVPTRPFSAPPEAAAPLADRTATVTQAWTYTVPEGAFTEPDGEALTYSAALEDGGALPGWLSFDAAARAFGGTPPAAAVSLALRIKVIASDPHGYGAASVFALDFEAVEGNNAPTLVAANAPAGAMPMEDAEFTLAVADAFADADPGDVLSYQAAVLPEPETPLPSAAALLARGHALPAWLGFDGATGMFRGVPDQAAVDAGGFTVVVTANDGRGGEAGVSFAVTPVNANDAPMVVGNGIPNRRAVIGERFRLEVSGYFADEDPGDTLALSAAPAAGSGTSLPAWLAFDAAAGVFSGTPMAADATAAPLRVTVTATETGRAEPAMAMDTFAIEVGTVANRAPMARGGALADRRARAGSPVTFTLPAGAFADADGDALGYRHVARPPAPWLELDADTGMFSGTPPAAAAGTAFAVTVIADDGWGGSVRADFTLAVGAANLAPALEFALPALTAHAGLPFAWRVAGNAFRDGDLDELTFTAALADGGELPGWLEFDEGAGEFRGTPGAADVDSDAVAIEVTASDGFGGSMTAEFGLTVEPAPEVASLTGDGTDGFSLALPYVTVLLEAAGTPACAAMTLRAAEGVSRWTAVTDVPAGGCDLSAGAAAVPVLAEPGILHVPLADYHAGAAGRVCLAMELALADGDAFGLTGLSARDCPPQ